MAVLLFDKCIFRGQAYYMGVWTVMGLTILWTVAFSLPATPMYSN